MYLFMPPLAHLEDYLELLAAIEATGLRAGRQARARRLSAARANPAPEAAAGDPRPGA